MKNPLNDLEFKYRPVFDLKTTIRIGDSLDTIKTTVERMGDHLITISTWKNKSIQSKIRIESEYALILQAFNETQVSIVEMVELIESFLNEVNHA